MKVKQSLFSSLENRCGETFQCVRDFLFLLLNETWIRSKFRACWRTTSEPPQQNGGPLHSSVHFVFLQRLKMSLGSADTADKFQFVLCTVAVSNEGSVSPEDRRLLGSPRIKSSEEVKSCREINKMTALDMRGEHHVNTTLYGGGKKNKTPPRRPLAEATSGLKQAHGTKSATSAVRKPGALC